MSSIDIIPDEPKPLVRFARMLWADKLALAAVLFLLLVLVLALIGPSWLGEAAQKQNLRGRNAPPFEWERGWLWILGAAALGGSLGFRGSGFSGRLGSLSGLSSGLALGGLVLGKGLEESVDLVADGANSGELVATESATLGGCVDDLESVLEVHDANGRGGGLSGLNLSGFGHYIVSCLQTGKQALPVYRSLYLTGLQVQESK